MTTPESIYQRPLHKTIIGRDAELSILCNAVDGLLAGTEQFFVMTGETGIGKTLLLNGVHAYIHENALQHDIYMVWASGHVIKELQPYHVWLPLLTEILGLHTADTKKFAGAQQGAVLAHLYTTDSSLIEWAALLNDIFPLDLPESQRLLDMPFDEKRKKRCYVISQLIFHAAKGKPLVFLLDDVDWFDQDSWHVLEMLIATERHIRYLVVMGARYASTLKSTTFTSFPISEASWVESPQAQHIESHIFREIKLQPLSKLDTEMILSQRWQVKSFDTAIIDFIYARTQGYPLYSKGIADALLSKKTIQINEQKRSIVQVAPLVGTHLPDTVQNVITSQLDQLVPRLQLTLKVASVIGLQFDLNLLYTIYPVERDRPYLAQCIQQLLEELWIQPYPLALDQQAKSSRLALDAGGDVATVYQFRLAVVQEVAYNLMSVAQRQTLEQAIGERLNT